MIGSRDIFFVNHPTDGLVGIVAYSQHSHSCRDHMYCEQHLKTLSLSNYYWHMKM